MNYGDWRVPAHGAGGVWGKPLLLTCAKPLPLLIHVASAAVAGKGGSPLVLGGDGEFVTRGRLDSTADEYFGMTLNRPKGGFAGKFIARRMVKVTAPDEPFEWTVPCANLAPTEPVVPPTPVGFEIVECWCLTLHTDHGLAVESMESRSDR